MNPLTTSSFFQSFTYTMVDIPLNIGLALLLGILIALVYRSTTHNAAISQSFIITLIMLSMVSSLVIMIIGNSLIRAFSLIGALSIIRFRTVVKENRDIAFIFLALGTGMASGIGNYQLAIFGVLSILVALLIVDFVRFGSSNQGVFLLRFQLVPESGEGVLSPIFSKRLVSYGKLSMKSVRNGDFVEHAYMVRLKKGETDQTLLSDLQAIRGIERITLVADDSESEL